MSGRLLPENSGETRRIVKEEESHVWSTPSSERRSRGGFSSAHYTLCDAALAQPGTSFADGFIRRSLSATAKHISKKSVAEQAETVAQILHFAFTCTSS